MNVGLEHYLVVSVLLFCLGLARRDRAAQPAGHLHVAGADAQRGQPGAGGLFAVQQQPRRPGVVFFIITVAAAEVAVGLALIVALYRKRQTAHVEDLTTHETLS